MDGSAIRTIIFIITHEDPDDGDDDGAHKVALALPRAIFSFAVPYVLHTAATIIVSERSLIRSSS